MSASQLLWLVGVALVGLTLVFISVVLLRTPALIRHEVRTGTMLGFTFMSAASFFLGAGVTLVSPFDEQLIPLAILSLAIGSAFAVSAMRQFFPRR